MKLISDNKAPVTKKGLKKSGERLEKKLYQKYTKRLLDSQNAFRIELQHQFLMQDESWERRFTRFENRIYNLIEPLVKDAETCKLERSIATNQYNQLQERVTKLENA